MQDVLDKVLIDSLQERCEGEIIRPADAGYGEARTIWNAMSDRYPALIARSTSSDDVVEAVNFARDNDLLLLVQRGFKNVRCYAGGLLDWQKESYPLGTGSDRSASGQQAITRVGPALAPVAKPTGASPPR
jgi:hypothetical protein